MNGEVALKKNEMEILNRIEKHIAIMNHSSERQADAIEKMAEYYKELVEHVIVIKEGIKQVTANNWKLIFTLLGIIGTLVTAIVGVKVLS